MVAVVTSIATNPIVGVVLRRVVAVLAPILSSVVYVPQLFKTFRRKSLKDISFYSIAMLLVVDTLWLVHGWFIDDLSLMVSGLAQVFCVSCLVGMYWIYI